MREQRPRVLVTLPADVTRETILPPTLLGELAEIGDIELNEFDRDLTPDELSRRLPGVAACLVGWGTPRFDAAVLARADALRFIGVAAGTVRPYVSPDVFARGITVVTGASVIAPSVAECALLLMLAALRDLPRRHRILTTTADWPGGEDAGFRSEALFGQRVGLIGLGRAALALVELLRPFGCQIRAFDPHADPAVAADLGLGLGDLDEILAWARIVSVHAASTPETYHLLDGRRLRLLRPGAILVNTSRGAVVDELALVDVLGRGELTAALDVYEVEPLPADSRLRTLSNVILLPHVAGPTPDRRWLMAAAVIQDLRAFLAGQPVEHGVGPDAAGRMSCS